MSSAVAALSNGSGIKAITSSGEGDSNDSCNDESADLEPEWPPTFPLGNPSDPTNDVGSRVDYSFQPSLVENDYVNAIMAHSSYFQNSDLLDFLVSRLTVKADGHITAVVTAASTSSAGAMAPAAPATSAKDVYSL